MTFKEFVHKYTNQDNPATGVFWTEAEILTDSKLSAAQFVEYQAFINKLFTETYLKSKGATILNADQLSDAWDAAHPIAGFVLKTPYGDVDFKDKPVTSCSVVELASIVVQAIKKG